MEPGKFSRDVWWNVGSLAVAGVCGVLLNYLIGVVHGTAALGIFNQVFTFYLVASQLAALGLHYSALAHIAAAEEPGERREIATSAMIATLATGTAFAIALLLAAGPAGDLVDSPEVARGIRFAAPGVLFFALDKVALGCLNGLGRMRLYAVLFGLRFVLMIVAFAGCVVLGAGRAVLPVILTISEAAVFLLCLPALRRELGRVPRAVLSRWIRHHVRYGVRGFMSGIFAEFNTRIDILLLGVFEGDAAVGAYSFAAILAEGAYQLVVALRANYAPLVVRAWAAGRTAELVAMMRRTRHRVAFAAAGIGAIAILGYIIFVPLVTEDPALADSWPYFAILIVGMAISAGHGVFMPLLLYIGRPGWHSVLMLAIVVINAAGNLALIPAFGALGSAIATAISFIAGAALLHWGQALSLKQAKKQKE